MRTFDGDRAAKAVPICSDAVLCVSCTNLVALWFRLSFFEGDAPSMSVTCDNDNWRWQNSLELQRASL